MMSVPWDLGGRQSSRRSFLKMGAGVSIAIPLASTLAGCTGASTTGGSSFMFLSTQFTPVEEKQRFEKILADRVTDPKVSFNSLAVGDFTTQVQTLVGSGKAEIGLLGALHGDLAPLTDYLADVDDLVPAAAAAGISDDMLALGKFGGTTQKYIPWMQASYVVAVNKKALDYLPAGADVNHLTYDDYVAWAEAGKKATGSAIFGFPAGPKGLYHRWVQGYLLPSFTGAQVTRFTSDDAIAAWEYMQRLWKAMNPASTNYDNMQEPLARGEVLVAWDHVARLVDAPKEKPDDWLMVPSPTGPKGLGYMLIIAGFAVPKDADKAQATTVINALSTPQAQLDVLRQNAFFPVVKADLPSDLPAPISLEAAAVAAQASSPDALLALPPIGLGAKDGEMSQVFKDCFTAICLQGQSPKSVVTAQAEIMQKILDEAKVPCWAPDPIGAGVCDVG